MAPTPIRRASRSVPQSPCMSPRMSIFPESEAGEGLRRPSTGFDRPSLSSLSRNNSTFFQNLSPLESPPTMDEESGYLHHHHSSPSPNSTVGLGITTPTLTNYSFPILSPNSASSLPPPATSSVAMSATTTSSRPGQARRVSRMEEKESALATKHHHAHFGGSPPTMFARIRTIKAWSWLSLAAWFGEGLMTKWTEEVVGVFWPAVLCYVGINLTYSW